MESLERRRDPDAVLIWIDNTEVTRIRFEAVLENVLFDRTARSLLQSMKRVTGKLAHSGHVQFSAYRVVQRGGGIHRAGGCPR